MNLFLLVARKALQMRSGMLVLITVTHFFLFWFALGLTEARDARILAPADYWYYWWTTVLTIGYGDLSPQSIGGRIIAPFFEFSGILLLAGWLGKAGNAIVDYESKKRRGLMPTHAHDHLLVIGDYDPVNTRNLLINAVNDAQDDGRVPTVVGCFRNTGDKNPFLGVNGFGRATLEYVQTLPSGFTLDTFKKANAEQARHIYVMADDDAMAIGIICMLSHLSIPCRVALILKQESSVAMVPQCNLDLAIIRPVTAALAVREMEDPGTASAIQELLSVGVGHSLYSLRVKTTVAKYGVASSLLRTLSNGAALPIGFSRQDVEGVWSVRMSPSDYDLVSFNDCLLYIAERDLSDAQMQEFEAKLVPA